jgi:hypothetical protein
MDARMVVFFVVATSVWVAAHLYVSRSLLGRGQLSERARRRGAWTVAALCVTSIVTMFLGRIAGDGDWLMPVRWVGFTYMGLFTLTFFLVLARDAMMLTVRLGRRAAGPKPAGPADPERRRFLANATNAGVLGMSGAIGGYGLYGALREPELVRVDVPIENLPAAFEGFRIAQLSDIHIGPTIKGDFLRSLVERVNALDADLVAVTGDLVDGKVEQLREHVAPLADLRGKDGVYFVTGNHEYYWGPEEWVAELRRLGLTVLHNEHRSVERDGARLAVAGCTDFKAERHLASHASDPGKALRGAEDADVKLLLAHQPKSIHAAAEAGFDLQISGHTHGGQFFPITLFVGFAHPFVEGLGRLARTWIYVNRGTGYWGPPLRTNRSGEITELRLHRA